jgi:hypothetical protein
MVRTRPVKPGLAQTSRYRPSGQMARGGIAGVNNGRNDGVGFGHTLSDCS